MAMYDITYTQFYVQLLKSVTVTDIVFGLVKAVIFGFVIALIGCQCGMNTGAVQLPSVLLRRNPLLKALFGLS